MQGEFGKTMEYEFLASTEWSPFLPWIDGGRVIECMYVLFRDEESIQNLIATFSSSHSLTHEGALGLVLSSYIKRNRQTGLRLLKQYFEQTHFPYYRKTVSQILSDAAYVLAVVPPNNDEERFLIELCKRAAAVCELDLSNAIDLRHERVREMVEEIETVVDTGLATPNIVSSGEVDHIKRLTSRLFQMIDRLASLREPGLHQS